MKTHPQAPTNEKVKIDTSVLQALAIMIIGILVSVSILFVSGAAQDIYDDFYKALPKFSRNQAMKGLDSYEDLTTVLNSQPRLSYNTNAKYLFVENSDMNCVNCANFNGYNSKDNSYSAYKLKRDFVETGKMDYAFVDFLVFDSLDKHNSAYCVAEQNTDAYFEFKLNVYKNYDKTFDVNTAKGYYKGYNLDNKKFEDCYSSQKYKDRVEGLSLFSGGKFSTSSTPTFHLFKVEEKEVIKSDGTKVKEKSYTKVTTITGNVDYDITLKPQLENLIQ